MSKELDKIKECLDFFCRRCNEQGFYSPPLQPIVKEAYEAIAALRSEPVAIVDANDDGFYADILPDRTVKVGQYLYAAPLREDQRSEAAQVNAADGSDAASQGRCKQSSDHPTEKSADELLREKVRRYLQQLAPHASNRDAAVLLRECLAHLSRKELK